MAMSSGDVNSTELIAALINQKESLVEGILHAQEMIDGSVTLIIMNRDGSLIAARDKMGRLPILIGHDDNGYCVSFESFAYQKLGYHDEYELGPGEIVRITPDGYETLSPARDKMKICAFLWVYYGYPELQLRGRQRGGHALSQRRDHGARRGRPRLPARRGLRGRRARLGRAPRHRLRQRSAGRPSPAPSSSTPPPGRARSCRATRRCATTSPR